MNRCRIAGLSAALLALASCGTEQLGPGQLTIVSRTPDGNNGAFEIVFAPPGHSLEEQQTSPPNLTLYHVFLDDSQLAFDGLNGAPEPAFAIEGASTGGGYISAGMRRVRIAPAGGGATIFDGAGEITPGSMTRLYLFGDRAALQGRFVSYPIEPAPSTLHVGVMNLVRNGPGIEVVSCADAAGCTPLSPALRFGQSYDADLAAGSSDETRYRLAGGEKIRYRQVATAALPDPPVQELIRGIDYVPQPTPLLPPANLIAAPIFMSADGNLLSSF